VTDLGKRPFILQAENVVETAIPEWHPHRPSPALVSILCCLALELELPIRSVVLNSRFKAARATCRDEAAYFAPCLTD
jgi:hypothetical protein